MAIQEKYIIKDREVGNIIDIFSSLEEAKKALEIFEKEDREEGIFIENFYEIVKK